MNNARRRMVVQRYSNRPPFDMKGKEMSTVGKNYKKSYEHIEKSFRTIMNHLDAIQADEDSMEPPEKKSPINNVQNSAKCKTNSNIPSPVPRILESFQKAAPKRQPLGLRNNPRRTAQKTEARLKKPPRTANSNESDKFALQTLYRNKNIDFGKNVPNHHMMRNLLQNYDEPMEEYHTPVKKTTSINKPVTIKRLDKATSTTDILREEQRQKPSRKPSYKLRTSQKSKTRMPRAQSRGLISKTCASRTSTEEPFLTDNKIISSPSYVCSICESNFVLEDEAQMDKSNSNYVSRQVKKLNNCNNNELFDRYGKNAKKSDNMKFGARKNGYRLQKLKSHSKIKTNNVASRNYLGMMDTVKKKVPRMMEMNNETMSTDNKYDWSDEQPEPETSPHVKFPKETRCAMDRMMDMRTPLTKYMKPKELTIKPAISFNHKDACVTKASYTRNTSPYTICNKLEPIPGSKESGGIGDHVGTNVINSGKGIPCGRPGSRVTRIVQKPRGVR